MTVTGTTPYAWPYDGTVVPERVALLVVTSPGAPTPGSEVDAVAGAVRAAGGVVVHVTTTPPRRGSSEPVPTLSYADRLVPAAGIDGFYGSSLDIVLRELGRDQLLLVGGWLETSVHSTMRSANDRGYECLLVLDACTPFDPSILAASRSQIEMSGGIFGAVGESSAVLAALADPDLSERTAS